MPFHAYTKPADYVALFPTSRGFIHHDSALTAGNVVIRTQYQGLVRETGPYRLDGTDLFPLGTAPEMGPPGQYWGIGNGTWGVTGGNLYISAPIANLSLVNNLFISDNGYDNNDVSVDVKAGAGVAGMFTHGKDQVGLMVYLDIAAARVKAAIVFGSSINTVLFTGTTVIAADTFYTLRAAEAANGTVSVYVNGVLEGTFSLAGVMMYGATPAMTYRGVAFAGNGTAANATARWKNFYVAPHGTNVATDINVRNYDGDIVYTTTFGALADPTLITIPDSSLKQRSNRGPYGWYRVYLTGPDHGDSQWRTSYGDCSFLRIPNSSLPANGFISQAPAGLPGGADDEIARGVMGMGSSRIPILNSATPAATTIAAILPLVSSAKTWNTDTASAARPRRILVAFPNGTVGNEANITAIVNGLKSYVTAWEGRNEPNYYQDPTTWTTGEFAAFATAVKAGDPNAQVMGPGFVTFNQGIPWFQQFLDAGGANSATAFSFHPYNCYNGDLTLTRRNLSNIRAQMAAAGKSAYDMWMTEQGYAWNYAGVVWPRYAARWTALMYFGQSCITADKMRPETTAYWYDTYIGFDTFPMQWMTPAGPGPTVVSVRTMEAEIFGRTFTSELDFGTYGKDLYIGGAWSGADGTKAVGLMAASSNATDVLLNVTGASNLTCVDIFGNTFTLTAVNGRVSFPIAELPQWIRCPVGVAVTPVALGLTTNLALAATATSDGAPTAGGTSGTTYAALSNNVIAMVNNDVQENVYGGGNNPYILVSPTLPVTITLTWASVQTLNRIIVHSFPPWNVTGAPLAFTIDTWDGAAWTTRYTKTAPSVKSFAFTSGVARCTFETYFDEQWIFDAQFLTVATTKIRLVITAASYGSGEVGRAYEDLWGPWDSPGIPPTLAIREIQAFNDGGGGAAPLGPQIRNPAMGGVLR